MMIIKITDGAGGIKQKGGGMNSTMIYCKNFGTCHSTITIKKK
jgi:hypothetical protein